MAHVQPANRISPDPPVVRNRGIEQHWLPDLFALRIRKLSRKLRHPGLPAAWSTGALRLTGNGPGDSRRAARRRWLPGRVSSSRWIPGWRSSICPRSSHASNSLPQCAQWCDAPTRGRCVRCGFRTTRPVPRSQLQSASAASSCRRWKRGAELSRSLLRGTASSS